MPRRRQLVVLGLAALPVPAALAAPSAAPGFSGDREAVALVARANRSYERVPAVRVDAGAAGASFRFTLFLRNGVAWAERAVVNAGGRQIDIVGTVADGSFVKDPGAACWRFVPKSDPQAMEDLGRPLLTGPGTLARPRMTPKTIELVARRGGGEVTTIVLARRTLRIVRMSVASATGRATARFTALATAPPLPATKPRC